MICVAAGCDRTNTRPYMAGHFCPLHTPAIVAGRMEPPTVQITPLERGHRSIAADFRKSRSR